MAHLLSRIWTVFKLEKSFKNKFLFLHNQVFFQKLIESIELTSTGQNLTLSWIKLHNCQTYFENLAVRQNKRKIFKVWSLLKYCGWNGWPSSCSEALFWHYDIVQSASAIYSAASNTVHEIAGLLLALKDYFGFSI